MRVNYNSLRTIIIDQTTTEYTSGTKATVIGIFLEDYSAIVFTAGQHTNPLKTIVHDILLLSIQFSQLDSPAQRTFLVSIFLSPLHFICLINPGLYVLRS